MSTTPRTDHYAGKAGDESPHMSIVPTTFARELELKNAALLARAERAELTSRRYECALATARRERDTAEAEVKRLREALEKITTHKHHTGDTLQADIAHAALKPSP